MLKWPLISLIDKGRNNRQRWCLKPDSVGLPRWLSGKRIRLPMQEIWRRGFNPWVRKVPWRRRWQLTLVFLPGKSHGQRSLVDYSPWGGRESETNAHTLSTLQFVFQDNSLVCFSHLISSFWPTLTPGHFDQLWLIDQVLVLLNLCFPVASLNKSVGISQRVELRSECLAVFTRKQTWLYQKHMCIKVLPSSEPLG